MKWVLLLLLAGCAVAPKVINTSPFAACAASCPDGQAFTLENSVDVACFCKRPPVGSWMPRKCETRGCTHPECPPRPDTLDQSTGTLPATTWECPCGWKRTAALPRKEQP